MRRTGAGAEAQFTQGATGAQFPLVEPQLFWFGDGLKIKNNYYLAKKFLFNNNNYILVPH